MTAAADPVTFESTSRYAQVRDDMRALADGSGNFLHACIALIGRKDRLRRPDGIDHRKQPACDNAKQYGHFALSS